MANRIDALFQEWNRLSGRVLVTNADPSRSTSSPELLVAESTGHYKRGAILEDTIRV